MRCAGDDRLDFATLAVQPTECAGKFATENTLLNPRRALGQFAVGGEARELGARAGAARRTVVSLAGTEDKIVRVAAILRRAEEFDVIHLGKTLRVHSLPDAPGEIGERLDVGERQIVAM